MRILMLLCSILCLLSLTVNTTAQTTHRASRVAMPSPATQRDKVNINKSTAKELASIKGLGISRAKAIVDYRKQHGNFKSVDDISKVKGIGTKLMAKIQPYLTVK